MITCKFWKDDIQDWGGNVQIDTYEMPLKISTRFDERLAEGSFHTWEGDCPYDLPLEPYTKCRITIDDGTEYDFVVASYDDRVLKFGTADRPRYGKPRKASIALIDPLAITQQIYPDNLCFSNGLDNDGKVTTITISEMLGRISEQLWTVPEGDKNNPAYAPFRFYWDTNKFQQTAPEMFFTGMSLFEIFVQIGAVVGGFPTLKYVDSVGQWLLDFRMWQNNAAARYNNKSMVNVARHSSMEGYANVLKSDLQNMQNMSVDGENTIVEPNEIEFMPVSTEEYNTEISNDNISFYTKKPIAKILEMTFRFQGSPEERPSVTYNETNNFFMEYDKWRTLPALSLTDMTTWTLSSDGVCYYKKGDNKIINFYNASGSSPWNRLKLDFDPLSEPALHALRTIVRIKYIPYQEVTIKAHKPNAKKPIAEIYNQAANVLSSNAAGNNMQGTVERMEGQYTQWQKMLPRGGPLYKVGDWLNGGIIVAADHEFDIKFINSIYTTSPFNRRSQYVGVDNNIRLWNIPADKIIDRNLHYSEIVEVEINPSSAGVNNGSLTNKGQSILRNYSTTAKAPDLAYIAWKGLDEINADEDLQSNNYALATVSSLPIGKSIIMTWSTSDNVSMGSRSFNSGAEGLDANIANVQNYIEYNPSTLYLNLKFRHGVPIGYEFEHQYLPVGDNSRNENFRFSFPALTKREYLREDSEGILDTLINFQQFRIRKDLRERILFNFQLDFVGKNGTIVYDRGVTLNRLCNNTPTTFKIWVDSATPYSPYELKAHSDATLISGTIGAYTNLAVTDADDNLLFATNTAGNATSLNLSFVNKKREWVKL